MGGYAIYQGSILLIAQLMGGHGLSGLILGRIFVRDVIWTVALAAIHGCALAARAIFLTKQIIRS